MGVDINEDTVRIFSPVVVGRKGEYYQLLYDLLGKGYEKAKVDGELKNLREQIILSKYKKARHRRTGGRDFGDRIYCAKKVPPSSASARRLRRLLRSPTALVKIEETHPAEKGTDTQRLISAKFMCPYDGFSFPEIEPRLFSLQLAVWRVSGLQRARHQALHGRRALPGVPRRPPSSRGAECLSRKKSRKIRVSPYPKPRCAEKRGGFNIVELTNLSIEDAYKYFESLHLSKKDQEISKTIIKEICARLKFMLDVGLDYLTLNRRANTLSGGEAQRIRLASQLGSGLVGALYVLDEPTIGLHQRDNERLIKTLLNLRDLGNTIIVVEHDEDTIYSGDYLVDIGPGAGIHGGHIVVDGELDKLLTAKKNDSGSVTLAYLRGEKEIEGAGDPPAKRTKAGSGSRAAAHLT